MSRALEALTSLLASISPEEFCYWWLCSFPKHVMALYAVGSQIPQTGYGPVEGSDVPFWPASLQAYCFQPGRQVWKDFESIPRQANCRSMLSFRRPCDSLEWYSFKFSLWIKHCNDIPGKDIPVLLVECFVLLAVSKYHIISSANDILGHTDFDALAS